MGRILIKVGDATRSIDESQLGEARAQFGADFHVLGPDENANRIADEHKEDVYGGVAGKIVTLGANAASAATLSGSDALIRAGGGGDVLRNLDEQNPITSTIGGIAGTLLPGGAISKIGKVAKEAVAVGKEAGTVARVVSSGIGSAAEGTVMGFQQGVHELALSKDPINAERIASVVGSNMLLGGGIGFAAGTLGRAAERGLSKAKSAIDEGLSARALGGEKGLQAARETELQTIEQAKLADRAALADTLGTHQTTSGVGAALTGISDSTDVIAGKLTKAEDSVGRLLDNPKAIAKSTDALETALQREEHALEQMAKASETIRATTVTTAEHAAAIDSIPARLESNRAMQAKIASIAAEPASTKLAAIDKAIETSGSKVEQSEASKLATGIVAGPTFGAVAGAVGSIPVIGQIPGLAHLAGAKAAALVGDLMTGKLANATAAAAQRTSDAIGAFVKGGERLAGAAVPAAVTALRAIRYAPEDTTKNPKVNPSAPPLAKVYQERASELRSQVAYDETGTTRMRPEARQAVAARLAPIRAHDPVLADQIETVTARKVEFLADKLPKRPDLSTMVIGRDRWSPSDMEMRKFARFAAAVEDPGSVEERLAHGKMTPEDAEAYKAVYPERFASLVQQLTTHLGELRHSLSYEKQLALSMFSGVPITAAMNPQILDTLQLSYPPEGTQAQPAEPQFGSVSKSLPSPTPAQTRSN